jgi:hypothetical protein
MDFVSLKGLQDGMLVGIVLPREHVAFRPRGPLPRLRFEGEGFREGLVPDPPDLRPPAPAVFGDRCHGTNLGTNRPKMLHPDAQS